MDAPFWASPQILWLCLRSNTIHAGTSSRRKLDKSHSHLARQSTASSKPPDENTIHLQARQKSFPIKGCTLSLCEIHLQIRFQVNNFPMVYKITRSFSYSNGWMGSRGSSLRARSQSARNSLDATLPFQNQSQYAIGQFPLQDFNVSMVISAWCSPYWHENVVEHDHWNTYV